MNAKIVGKAGEIILDVAGKKISEYKSRQDWKKLFIDTGEFFLKNVDHAEQLFDDMANVLSKENMISLSQSVDDINGFHLKDALKQELEKLMCQYEIPYDMSVLYINHFMQVIIADIEKNSPEKYEQVYLSEWREEEKRELEVVSQRMKDIESAITEIQKRRLDIYTLDQIELDIMAQTEAPSISLDFFESDDEEFQVRFERKLQDECIYISGKCKEEVIYSILYELRKKKLNKGVLIIKNFEDWENLRIANRENSELRGKILIPWFWNEEIIAIPENINIFVYGEDDYCVGKDVIKMRKRTRHTIVKKLEQAGCDYQAAYQMVADTHGLYIPLKKKILKGSYNKIPNWVEGDITLTLPVLLCGKWAEEDGDKLVLEQLSGRKYSKFIEDIECFARGEDPLLVKYRVHGKNYYQLAGLENAWDYLNSKIDLNSKMWEDFIQMIFDIFVEADPEFDFPIEERHIRAIMPEGKSFWSDMIRQGMLRSLIMKAYYKRDIESQQYIDQVVEKILGQIKNVKQWLTLARYFPEFCEASPEVIKRRLEQEWVEPTGLIEVFKELSNNVVFGSHRYTYVLWGMEQFLLQKEYAAWAVRWLIKLANQDIEYTISNSPEEVLKEVFCPWINLTALTPDDKIYLAEEMVKVCKTGWELLYAVLPGQMRTVTGELSHPKYRDITEQSSLTNQDVYKTYKEYVRICISNMEFSYSRWEKMISEADELPIDMIKSLFEHLYYDIKYMEDSEKIAIKDAIRYEIYRHRYFENAVWAMKENKLECFEEALRNIHTDNPVYEYGYLFSYRSEFPLLHPMPYNDSENGFKKSREKNQEMEEQEIEKSIQEFKERQYDIDKLIEICASKENTSLGKYLYKYYSDGKFDDELFQKMLVIQPSGMIAIDYAMYAYRQNPESLNCAIQVAKKQKIDMEVMVRLYGVEIISVNRKPLIVDADESMKKMYWSYMHSYEDNGSVVAWMIEECKKHGTQPCLINILERGLAYLTPEQLLVNLECMKRMEMGEWGGMTSYYLEKILEVLQGEYRQTEECERVAQIELYYESKLNWENMGCFRTSLEKSPKPYADMIYILYLQDGEEKHELTEQEKSTADYVYDIFHKAVFCPAERDGIVDESELDVWVENLRKLLKKQNQKRLLGYALGRIFANSPIGNDDCYPCEAVRKVIENCEDEYESLSRSYTSAIYNKRGVYSPSAGKEEMELANGYKRNADKLRTRFPKTAGIYDCLYDWYKNEAGSERESAEYAEY